MVSSSGGSRQSVTGTVSQKGREWLGVGWGQLSMLEQDCGKCTVPGEAQKEEAVVEAKKLREHLVVTEKHDHCQPTKRGEELQNKYLTFPCPPSPSCHNQRKVRRHLHTVTFH